MTGDQPDSHPADLTAPCPSAQPAPPPLCAQPAPPSRWAEPGVPHPEVPPVASPAHVAVAAAVDVLLAGPVSGRPVDAATTLALAERLRGQALAELGELDANGLATSDTAPSAAVWLRRQQRIGDDTARATLALARRLREDLSGLGVLLRAGGSTLEHVRAVAAGTAGLDPGLVAEAQPALVDLVEATEPARARRELRERAHAIDPDLARDAARRQRARQGFYADPVGGAGVVLGGSLCEEDGSVLLHALDLHVQADRALGQHPDALPDTDRPGGTDTDQAPADGPTATTAGSGGSGRSGGPQDGRSLPARRAAALLDWARQAVLRLTGPGDTLAQDAHTARTHLLITCTPDQLTALADTPTGQHLLGRLAGPRALAVLTGSQPVEPGRLPTGGSLLPEALRRTTCDISLSLVLADHTGQPLRPAPPGATTTGSPAGTTTGTTTGSPAGTTTGNTTGSPAGTTTGTTGVDCGASTTRAAVHSSRGAAAAPPSDGGWSWRWAPLFVGRSSRTVTGAQFRALVVRDRHCVVAGCRRRPAQCEAHHVKHWLDGGATDLDNLVLLCHLHHHDHHDRGHDLQTWHGRWITQTGWADDPPGTTPAAA